jgi:acyl-CoA thioester hydrolase
MISDLTTSANSSAPIGILMPIEVHFDDLDALGMLHNGRYQVLVERAWLSFWHRKGFFGAEGLENDGFNVVKTFTITYDTPVTAFGSYAVNLWIEKIGTTSVVCGYRVCSADGEKTYAYGIRTAICLDRKTLLPTPWSDHAREVAGTIMATQAS